MTMEKLRRVFDESVSVPTNKCVLEAYSEAIAEGTPNLDIYYKWCSAMKYYMKDYNRNFSFMVEQCNKVSIALNVEVFTLIFNRRGDLIELEN